jgi:hypothetical protein
VSDEIVAEGARGILSAALEAEVDSYLAGLVPMPPAPPAPESGRGRLAKAERG